MRTLSVAAAALVLVAACSKNPSSPSSADPATTASAALTASVTTPRPVGPANNATIRNVDQPVTLIVANAISTQPGATYIFEVATDTGFAAKVQTKDAVTEGGGGQTSVRLDPLPAARDYFWHARATAGGTTGPFGATFKFTVGPAVVVTAPAPIAPLTGAQTGARPALRVSNAVRSGPVGTINYRFEIATSAAFNPVLVSATVGEGTNETGYIPTADLPINTTFFWRATATDTGSGVSATSAAQSFTTSLAIDLTKIVISYPDAPSEIASWKQTATILVVEQDGAGDGPMCIDFSLSDAWPSIPFFGAPEVPVYANQWYFANINGTWYAGPGEYLRADRASVCKTGQGTNSIGPDGGWNTVMRSWVPKVGELVGFMISTPARNYSAHRTINERSNVVLQPWRDTSLGSRSVGRSQ
jgi:hypothetical protein